jgi:cyclopropane-fatty-acyl-phospholipid synthase
MSDIRTLAARPRSWRKPAYGSALLIRQLRKFVAQAAFGSITIVLPNSDYLHHRAPEAGPNAKIVIRRWRAVWRLMTGGDKAFAQAFIDGDWWTPNLLALFDFSTRNEANLQRACAGTPLQRLLYRWQHWRHRNTRRGSRRNIAAHYDLGNEFYVQWLDAGMNYSSALFAHPDQSLEAAQKTKIERVVELLDIAGGERVLEIGCGWGAVMERLAPQCQVTGVTLSAEQLAYAQKRVGDAAGAQVRLQDYRDIRESYDRIVSIEMIEAVGERYWPAYFAKLRDALKPGGTVLLQAISIAEDRFAQYRNQPDFIQSYIFPGGVLPTVGIIRREAARAGLEWVSHQSFGESYARTLAIWRERFLASWQAIERLGFDASFKRMWEYYLCYCEIGFRSGAIDVGFFKLSRAD